MHVRVPNAIQGGDHGWVWACVALCSCNIAVVCLLQFQKHLLMRKLGIYKKKIKLSSQVTCCFAYFPFMCGWSGVLICSAVSLCVNEGEVS